jgi:hypothetical protein
VASENFRENELTTRQEDAAKLVAADELSDKQIAEQAGISDRQLRTWKKLPAFSAAVAEHRAAWRETVMQQGIADQAKRVAALQDRWLRMRRVIDARAEDMADEVPGGETGLLVRQIKSIGFGANNQTVEEYAVDTGLLKELRAHEEQAAKELGQWVDKHEDKIDVSTQFLNALREFGQHAHD